MLDVTLVQCDALSVAFHVAMFCDARVCLGYEGGNARRREDALIGGCLGIAQLSSAMVGPGDEMYVGSAGDNSE